MAQRTNTDTGKPSGSKPMQGTGIPTKVNDENTPNDERLTKEYTRDDEDVTEGTRERHPNRNVDKEDATGAGGYRN